MVSKQTVTKINSFAFKRLRSGHQNLDARLLQLNKCTLKTSADGTFPHQGDLNVKFGLD